MAHKCTFCGNGFSDGTGTILYDAKGKPRYFCSSKCEKNSVKLKRNPRKTRWSKNYSTS